MWTVRSITWNIWRASSTRRSSSRRNHRMGGSESKARPSVSASRGTSSCVTLRTPAASVGALLIEPKVYQLPAARRIAPELAFLGGVLPAVDRDHRADHRGKDAAEHDPV